VQSVLFIIYLFACIMAVRHVCIETQLIKETYITQMSDSRVIPGLSIPANRKYIKHMKLTIIYLEYYGI